MNETNAFRTTFLWIFIYNFRRKKIYTNIRFIVCLLRFFFSFPLPKLVLVTCFGNRLCVRVCFFSLSPSLYIRSIWRCHSTLLLLLFFIQMPWHDTLPLPFCQTLDWLRSTNERATHLTFDQKPYLTVRVIDRYSA